MIGYDKTLFLARPRRFSSMQEAIISKVFPAPTQWPEGIPTIQDSGNGIDLVGLKLDVRFIPGKVDGSHHTP
jgi:hypothetical protein